MHTVRALHFAEPLMRTPTAPFREHWMCAVLDGLLAEIPGIQVRADEFGNRIAVLPGGLADAPPVVMVAHLDHPGFVFPDSGAGPARTHRGTFEGRVRDEYFEGAAVRLFRSAEDPGVSGRIREYTERTSEDDNRRVVIEAEEPITDPVLAMWDLPSFAADATHLSGRACDDLAGCAAILAALEVLARADRSHSPPAIGLFTRAEEAGFCGALCLAGAPNRRQILPDSSFIISVETSSARPFAPVGGGAIVRVGDRATTFDRGLLDLMWRSTAGGRERGSLTVSRALMDGGTCEATAFVAHGFRAAGACVPVANYHNMDLERGALAPERVSLFDLEMLTRLLATVAGADTRGNGAHDPLRKQLDHLQAIGLQQLEPVPPAAIRSTQ